MSNTMLSKPTPVYKPPVPVKKSSMEAYMSSAGANFGRMLDDLAVRSRRFRGILSAEASTLGSRLKAWWAKLKPALGRAWNELALGFKDAAKSWQNPDSAAQ